MPCTRRTLTLALSQMPGVGGKSVARVLAYNDIHGVSPDAFLKLGPEALREQYKFKDSLAGLWSAEAKRRIAAAEKERETLDAFGVALISQADPHYPVSVETFDPNPPGLIYAYGNTKLLKAKTFAVLGSRGTPLDAMTLIDHLVEEYVLKGKVLVSSHDTPEYQRSAVVPLRWGSPRILVLDCGLFNALGPNLADEPFAAARLWRFQFDPKTDLVLSAVTPRGVYHRNSNRMRDRLVFGLAQQVDLAWVKPGGNMARLALMALNAGRQVRVNPICLAAEGLISAGAKPIN